MRRKNPKIVLNMASVTCLKEGELHDLVSTKTRRFFREAPSLQGFLIVYPDSWAGRDDFKNALKILKELKVVNDHFLIKSFNRLLMKGEEQLQFPLQVVSDHRRWYIDAKKETSVESRQQ